jgi:Transposase DDE domain
MQCTRLRRLIVARSLARPFLATRGSSNRFGRFFSLFTGDRQKRAVAEYLTALEVEAATEGDTPDDGASGGPEHKPPRRYERKPPKVISPSDPQSAWTAKANKRVQFGYGLNYLIDIKNAVIVDVEATPARTYDEVAATKTMLDRTEQCFNLRPKRLAADTAYGTGKFLGWLVKEKKIIPHIPVWEMSERQDGIFSRSDFRWDGRREARIERYDDQIKAFFDSIDPEATFPAGQSKHGI